MHSNIIRFTTLFAALLTHAEFRADSAWAAEPTPITASKPTAPPQRFPSGTPIRSEKLAIKPSEPNPYHLLRDARELAVKGREAGPTPSVAALIEIAYLQIQAGDHRGALITLREAETLERSQDFSPGNAYLLAKIGDLCGFAGDAERGFRICRDAAAELRNSAAECKQEAIVEHLQYFGVVSDAFDHLGRSAAARETLSDAETCARRANQSSDDRQIIFRLLAELQMKRGDFEKGITTFRSVHIPSDFTCDESELVPLLIKLGELARAGEIARRAVHKAQAEYFLKDVVQGYVAAKNPAAALEFAKLMPDSSRRTDALLLVIHAQIAAGLFAEATTTIRGLQFDQTRRLPLLSLAEAKFARGDRAGSQEILREVVEMAVPSTERWSPQSQELHDLIERLATDLFKMGLEAEAKRVLNASLDNAAAYRESMSAGAVFALARWAEAQRTIGDEASARKTARQAVELMKKYESTGHDERRWKVCLALAKVQTKLGDSESAKEMFRQAVEDVKKGKKAEHVKDELLFELIQVAQARLDAGDRDGALQIAADVISTAKVGFPRYVVAKAAFAAAPVYFRAGDIDRGEALIRSVDAHELRGARQSNEREYAAITGLVRHGRTTAALEIAEKSRSIAPYLCIAEELFRQNGLQVTSHERWNRENKERPHYPNTFATGTP